MLPLSISFLFRFSWENCWTSLSKPMSPIPLLVLSLDSTTFRRTPLQTTPTRPAVTFTWLNPVVNSQSSAYLSDPLDASLHGMPFWPGFQDTKLHSLVISLSLLNYHLYANDSHTPTSALLPHLCTQLSLRYLFLDVQRHLKLHKSKILFLIFLTRFPQFYSLYNVLIVILDKWRL